MRAPRESSCCVAARTEIGSCSDERPGTDMIRAVTCRFRRRRRNANAAASASDATIAAMSGGRSACPAEASRDVDVAACFLSPTATGGSSCAADVTRSASAACAVGRASPLRTTRRRVVAGTASTAGVDDRPTTGLSPGSPPAAAGVLIVSGRSSSADPSSAVEGSAPLPLPCAPVAADEWAPTAGEFVGTAGADARGADD